MNNKYKSDVAILLGLLIISGLFSVWSGQDSNWDLKNYHLYNAWALLHNRLTKDVFAAGIQTYFHPLLDLPYYFIAVKWLPEYPRVVSFIAGLPFGVLVFLTWLVARKITSYMNFPLPKDAHLVAILATILGVTGSASISQVGTTFNEIQPAILNIAGLFFLLKNLEYTSNKSRQNYLLFAGSLFGLSAGLKLTSIVFTLGAIVALLVTAENWKSRISATVIFGSVWLLAFGISFGWWGYKLWQLTGNPVFPLYNKVFASSWAPVENILDVRFKPKSIFQAIFYPFFWLTPKPMVITEVFFADFRFAFAYLGGLSYCLAEFSQKLRKIQAGYSEHPNTKEIQNRMFSLIFIFTAISYIAWESLFSILRYAVSIEVLCGVIFSLGLYKLAVVSQEKIPAILVITIAFLMITTTYPEWGRSEYSSSTFVIEAPVLPNKSLVLLVKKPIAYIAPFIKTKNGESPEFVGVDGEYLLMKDYQLGEIARTKILNHKGPIFVIARPEWQDWGFLESEFEISVNLETCEPIDANIDETLKLCKVNLIKQ